MSLAKYSVPCLHLRATLRFDRMSVKLSMLTEKKRSAVKDELVSKCVAAIIQCKLQCGHRPIIKAGYKCYGRDWLTDSGLDDS